LELLKAVGMGDQAHKYPSQISGGQKQRVAVARALVTNASLVLADEPTANLDRKTANQVIELMKKMRDEFGTSLFFPPMIQEWWKMLKRSLPLKMVNCCKATEE